MPDKLAAIIYLLNTNNMTANQIQAAATSYSMMPDKMAAIIYLLANASGGGSGTGATFGDYGGGQPSFTPSSGVGLAVDTSNGTLWQYYNSAWH